MRKLLVILLTTILLLTFTSCGASNDNETIEELKRQIAELEKINEKVENDEKDKPTIPEEEKISEDTFTVPDIAGLDAEDAKQILINNDLLPAIEFEFSETKKANELISTLPKIGDEVKKNDKVILTYSKGKQFTEAIDSNIEWYHINSWVEDDWEFFNPYIDWEDNILYIEIFPTLATTVELNDRYDNGYGIATAFVTDPYDKELPAQIEYSDSKIITAGEEKELLIKLPLGDLDREKAPTDFMLLISIFENGIHGNIELHFRMTW